jgi:transcriptional regulator with XRE-family HTH domain
MGHTQGSRRAPLGELIAHERQRRGLTRVELAALVRRADRTLGTDDSRIKRWEHGQEPQPAALRALAAVLEQPVELLTALVREGSAFAVVVIDPDDVPPVEDVEDAVMRLRRSYSTTPPLDLEQRVNTRLQQVRRLLAGQVSPPAQHNLAEAAAWLVLLRGTVQFDSRQHEAAWTSARAAQQLARDIGHRDLVAWTFETMAWMAATDNRQFEARELASAGIAAGPPGGFGLVAATLQRARINGAMGDRTATMQDLRAGERALAAAGEAAFPDDHYEIDPAKARFFASGAWAQLRRPAETIENAAEVVRASEDPKTRNYWPMRVANARVEWAMALTDLGEEDEAAALAALALEPLWLRPDTERRMRELLARMRDARLRSQLAEQMHDSQAVARILSAERP